MGIIYLAKNDLKKAKENFEFSLNLCENNIISLVGLGNVFYELNDFEEATIYHQKVYNIDNQEIQAIIGLGNTLYSQEVTKYF